MQDPNLPPGCSDADIDRHANGPMCNCGHFWCDHNDDEHNSCDCYTIIINSRTKKECPCTKFEEGWPEPDDQED